MCGFLFTDDISLNKEVFVSALNLMHHRGPDATGVVCGSGYFMGHNRLKILDLDNRSNQPLYSQNGRYIIIFNGEIYNFKELARKYKIEQKTIGDTEVLLELYIQYGPKCLAWLNGMFAFVIYDLSTGEVFAARDRLGVKPLYMCSNSSTLTLASEIAPILHLTGISRVDEIGLRQYKKLRTFFNGHTLYKGIEMFPAGHYLQYGKLVRYWSLPEISQGPPSDEELLDMITTSVKQRLLSDVPVGSYLSGGLDSTIVAALSHKPHTWTVGFSDCNEFEWGRLAAENMDSIHHEVLITPKEFLDLGRMMIRKRCEPLSVPNEVLLYKMTSEAKALNTVILSGEGADELFFGYDRIFRWAANAKNWDIEEFSRLYSYGSHPDIEIVEDAISPFRHLGDPLAIVAHFFQISHLHGLLRRLDNSTMICSVEARVPFVDYHPLVERMAGVPFSYRMQGGVVKAPLKRVFQKILPQGIIQRKKVGFPVPLKNIPFNHSPIKSAMDQWLEFNLEVLTGSANPIE